MPGMPTCSAFLIVVALGSTGTVAHLVGWELVGKVRHHSMWLEEL